MVLAQAATASGAWVSFQPCGFDGLASAGEYVFAPAPSFARIWVRRDVPGSILVPKMKRGAVECVYVRAAGGQALVVGSEFEVLCKLSPDEPQCKGARDQTQAGP